MVNLETTNLLLGIMAAVSILEAICLIGAGVGGFLVYRRVMQLVHELEQRQVAPAMARVTGILDDVKGVTPRVNDEAERVDHAIRDTIDRVDETADRVRARMRVRTARLVGIARGIRAALDAFANGHEHRPPAEATGRP